MKIVIDISQIVYGTGVSVYTKELVKNLAKIDKTNEYILFGSSFRRNKELMDFADSVNSRNFSSKIIGLPPSILEVLWNKLHIFPIEKFVGQIDIVHTSDWVDPPTKAKKISTLHDLSWKLFPNETNPKIINAHSSKLAWIKKESDFVIVPSEATKMDAVKLGVESNKIKVIPEGVSSEFKPLGQERVDKVIKKYGLDAKYLLAVGTTPRKNIKKIVNSYSKIQFVIVGKRPQGLFRATNAKFLGHVPTDDLVALYNGAQALVYASIYEGFGLPIIEAFACKCPVVCSDTSSLPEVAGKAAVLVDPNNENSIAHGIETALNDRKKYINAGLVRSKSFSFKKMAESTLKIYNTI